MINFITNRVPDPWTYEDLLNYDNVGSQRDEIIYNSYHNAKIRLCKDDDLDYYLCSFKLKSGLYKNFFVVPVKRNQFFLVSCVPQIAGLKEAKKDSILAKAIQQLPLFNYISQNIEIEENVFLSSDISLLDNCLIIKVNASIGQFLFPRHKVIDDEEIKQKIMAMGRIYYEAEKEWEFMGCYMDKLSEEYNKKYEERKKELLKIIGRRIVICAASIALSTILGVCLDNIIPLDFDDSYLDLSEFDYNDFTDNIDSGTVTFDDVMSDYNPSFMGNKKEASLALNDSSDGFIRKSDIKLKRVNSDITDTFKLFVKNGVKFVTNNHIKLSGTQINIGGIMYEVP